ncbi:MAG: NAD-dependent epimerase/dehydratase family protein [Planctomycetaceae bacterium]|nr:NAD-dependent epimerase/dehydratase family protein [Planctomycetales bacterium]MCB9927360.1 NAD-dependent epimerase/dehydratase family protein [Planctomycetaceae bacterium]
MQRLIITGSSGYLGRKLVAHFRRQGKAVMGIDVAAPPEDCAPDEFVEADIRDTALLEVIRDYKPDTIIHAAFVFQPIRDTKRMTDINIGGTDNVLRIVDQLTPTRFMLVSSATAFGAWPDNPVPMAEDWPLRARHDYQYAADKTAIEDRITTFSKQHPEIAVSWIRPAIIGGPGMENYLSRFIFGMPFLAKLDGFDTPIQFVHEDDVVAATDAILQAGGCGAYNVGPPNWTCASEIASETNRRVLAIPFWLAWSAAWLAWTTRLWIHESPASFLYFARYPWVVAPHRLVNEIGYEFRYTSTETVREIVRAG